MPERLYNTALRTEDAVVDNKLNPMKDAPRDGTEILAYHKEGKNFHPVMWVDWKWRENNRPHWGMRWNKEYITQDGFYSGWIPYPMLGA